MNLRMPFFVVSFTFASLARLVSLVVGAGADAVSDFVPRHPMGEGRVRVRVIGAAPNTIDSRIPAQVAMWAAWQEVATGLFVHLARASVR